MTATDPGAARDLRAQAAAAPAHPAIVCGDERLSYAELEALANRIADVFRGLGLERGDHVASLLGNRPVALALAWGAYRCGLYLTPVATTLAPPEIAYLVDDCEAKAVVADAALGARIAALPSQGARPVHWLSFGGTIAGCTELETLLASASAEPHVDEPPGALMVYTSGTTGAPKGVVRPMPPAGFRGTPAFAADLHALFDLDGADRRYLSTAPLYHAAPLRFALAVTAGGGTVHVMERFDAELALQLIEHEGITHSQWVPAMFQRLLELPAARRAAFRAPAHRSAVHGAAPCPPELKRAMIDWWGPILLEYYSGSEGVGLTLIDSAEALQRPGSVGRARKGTLHIVDPAGNELPAGATGLVCFSGVAPFAYHKAPEKTAHAPERLADLRRHRPRRCRRLPLPHRPPGRHDHLPSRPHPEPEESGVRGGPAGVWGPGGGFADRAVRRRAARCFHPGRGRGCSRHRSAGRCGAPALRTAARSIQVAVGDPRPRQPAPHPARATPAQPACGGWGIFLFSGPTPTPR